MSAAASGPFSVRPTPSDEEAAAIVAAIEVATPRGSLADEREDSPRWRFSGRWWTKPVPLSRARPW